MQLWSCSHNLISFQEHAVKRVNICTKLIHQIPVRFTTVFREKVKNINLVLTEFYYLFNLIYKISKVGRINEDVRKSYEKFN